MLARQQIDQFRLELEGLMVGIDLLIESQELETNIIHKCLLKNFYIFKLQE